MIRSTDSETKAWSLKKPQRPSKPKIQRQPDFMPFQKFTRKGTQEIRWLPAEANRRSPPLLFKDIGAFLRKINDTKGVPRDSILVTMDVKALYTSIPYREGINIVTQALERRQTPTVTTRVIVELLSMISLLMINTIFKKRAALWAARALDHTSTCSWAILRPSISTQELKTGTGRTQGSKTTFSWYGQTRKNPF